MPQIFAFLRTALVITKTAITVASGEAVPAECPEGVNTVTKAVCVGPASSREYLDLVTDPSDYDGTQRPPCGNSTHIGPTVVEVQMRLTQLNSVDVKLGMVTVNGYFRSWWNDPRLAFKSTDEAGCFDVIPLKGEDFRGRVWIPDIHIANLVTQEGDDMQSLLHVSPNGDVWQSVQVLWTVKTSFDLGELPYDEHIGKIVVGSFTQDQTQVRLVARKGTIGNLEDDNEVTYSGEGVSAPRLTSAIWSFDDEESEKDGFQTAGKAYIQDGRSYVELWWKFSRRPSYFIDKVVVPCVVFTTLSYIQFWVDPCAAPARAFISVMPVLILKTMSNSIYQSIPEGSQHMWLDDFVTTSVFLSVFGTIQFGIVQYCRLLQSRKEQQREALKKAKTIVGHLLALAQIEGESILQYLQKLSPVEQVEKRTRFWNDDGDFDTASVGTRIISLDSVSPEPEASIGSPDSVSPEPEELTVIRRRQAKVARKENIKQADVLIVLRASDIFRKLDKDGTNCVAPRVVQHLISFFGIYMDHVAVAEALSMALRDSDEETPLDEKNIRVNFCQVLFFMTRIDQYDVMRRKHSPMIMFRGLSGFHQYFFSLPPTERWDVVARIIWPILLMSQFILFYIFLSSFDQMGDTA